MNERIRNISNVYNDITVVRMVMNTVQSYLCCILRLQYISICALTTVFLMLSMLDASTMHFFACYGYREVSRKSDATFMLVYA